jgi:hypothetical protein
MDERRYPHAMPNDPLSMLSDFSSMKTQVRLGPG